MRKSEVLAMKAAQWTPPHPLTDTSRWTLAQVKELRMQPMGQLLAHLPPDPNLTVRVDEQVLHPPDVLRRREGHRAHVAEDVGDRQRGDRTQDPERRAAVLVEDRDRWCSNHRSHDLRAETTTLKTPDFPGAVTSRLGPVSVRGAGEISRSWPS